MIGAIIGDIVGSRFEFANHKSTDFELFTNDCRFTDDTVMTIAVAKALLLSFAHFDRLSENSVKCMQEIGRKHLNCGYGGMFRAWLKKSNPKPYQSYGNGAAMRISPVAYVAESFKQCIELSDKVTVVTHNHPEGIKGAQATALATWLARNGESKKTIRAIIEDRYYDLDFNLGQIRKSYRFDATCQGSVPQAIKAFLESTSFENAIRLAVSIGGDSDTIAAITGGIAGAYYGVPENLREQALKYLSDDLTRSWTDFETVFS